MPSQRATIHDVAAAAGVSAAAASRAPFGRCSVVLTYVAANLTAYILYAVLNPRIRYG